MARQLERVFVDSFAAFIEREQMVPIFSSGRVGEGIVAASELIAGRAERALAAAAFDERAMAVTSAGGGTETDAMLDGGNQRPSAFVATDTDAEETPGDTVAYLAAMAAHNADMALDLYTPDSQEMLAGQVVTRAQMDNVVRTYRDWPQPELLLQESVAVLRYPPQARSCAPWLLERGPGDCWRLDFVAMLRAFRCDTRNHWRVAGSGALGRYALAFEH